MLFLTVIRYSGMTELIQASIAFLVDMVLLLIWYSLMRVHTKPKMSLRFPS